ncbi:hypothetical protein SAMN05216600_104219 [Pseudomonas cuatrocienegasensis]|uniref:Uncharacterized protein n=1 Tax=Pseudomonas cuatrocienegasensis TaxID=543360 RepID=A0ABY1B924_9PSED|nr:MULTISPECIES: hypothetical protein [Pseudomonas]SEQ24729.1 hypothetical protein SAMN05216600_104219 [Pseudomonas cuatrocienegasensis]
MSAWKTQKGDEWIYEAGSIKSVADYNSENSIFVIKSISFSKHEASEKLLLNFLRQTTKFFPEAHVSINLRQLDPKTEVALNSLQSKSLISCNT